MRVLKIKDNIDLKELEKIGFKHREWDIYYKKVANSSHNLFTTEIIINPLNKKVRNQVVVYFSNREDLGNIMEEDIDVTAELDAVYDLINYIEIVEV